MTGTFVRPRRVAVSAALLVQALVGPLAAAPRPAGAQQEPDSVPHFRLDSLTVRVLGTPIAVGRSAYPISVAGRSELRDGKTGMYLEEALRALPGVQVQNRFNYAVGERVTIRGFGARAQFGVRSINVVVDGIPATLPDGQSTLDHVDIASLGRVEALRGPASALYGNASGGVLRFRTEVPTQAPLRQEATAVGGSQGLLRLQSTTSGTVGSAGYRLSVNRLSYDGFRREMAVVAGDTVVATPELRYGGAERLHVNGRLEQPLARGTLGLTLNHLDLDSENPGSVTQRLLEKDEKYRLIAPIYITNQTGKEVQQSQLGVTWTGPAAGLDIEAAVYALTRDFSNPLPADVVDVDRRAGGARLTLGRSEPFEDLELTLLVGGEFDFQDDDRREYANSGGKPAAQRLNQNESVRSAGTFVQASAFLLDRVTLSGGLRYDHTRFKVEDLFLPFTAGNPDDSGRRDMNKWSPTVGIHVAATPWLGLFANHATFFETPTTVELGNREGGRGGFNPDLDPQEGRTFEVGARGAYGDLFAYEVSVFRTALENELIPYEVPGQPGITYYKNAGSSNRNGWEATLRSRPLEYLSAQLSYTDVDARFEDYVVEEAIGTVRYRVDLAGKRIPGLAPRQLQATLRGTYREWFLEADAQYVGRVAVNDRNCLDPIALTPCAAGRDGFAEDYTLFGVRAGASALSLGRLEISPFVGVQNLRDERYVSSVTVNAFGNRFYEPGPGRTFFAGATLAVSR